MGEPIVETITIPKSEYEGLLFDSLFLGYLEVYGVYNWQGYEYAVEDFYNDYPEYKEE